MLYAAEKQGFI